MRHRVFSLYPNLRNLPLQRVNRRQNKLTVKFLVVSDVALQENAAVLPVLRLKLRGCLLAYRAIHVQKSYLQDVVELTHAQLHIRSDGERYQSFRDNNIDYMGTLS